jgi:hypothetical protein
MENQIRPKTYYHPVGRLSGYKNEKKEGNNIPDQDIKDAWALVAHIEKAREQIADMIFLQQGTNCQLPEPENKGRHRPCQFY